EIQNAIKPLRQLEEIIFFFDGDKAGNEAVEKYAELLRELHPNAVISKVETPENEDVNSLLLGHSPEIFTALLDQRKEVNLFLSSEKELVEETQQKEKTHNPKPITQNSTIDFLQQP